MSDQIEERLSMNYVLDQIEKLSFQTQHLESAMQKNSEVEDYAGDLVVGQTKGTSAYYT